MHQTLRKHLVTRLTTTQSLSGLGKTVGRSVKESLYLKPHKCNVREGRAGRAASNEVLLPSLEHAGLWKSLPI